MAGNDLTCDQTLEILRQEIAAVRREMTLLAAVSKESDDHLAAVIQQHVSNSVRTIDAISTALQALSSQFRELQEWRSYILGREGVLVALGMLLGGAALAWGVPSLFDLLADSMASR